jgi:preprotein translocase subunit SecE
MAVTKQNQEAAAPTTFGLMKYVHAMFFAGAVVIGWILVSLIDEIWAAMHFRFGWVPAPNDWWAIGGGAALALILALYMWRHPKVTELSKVTWPTRKELSVSTVVVIVVSVIAAIILGLFDLFWSWATDFIY